MIRKSAALLVLFALFAPLVFLVAGGGDGISVPQSRPAESVLGDIKTFFPQFHRNIASKAVASVSETAMQDGDGSQFICLSPKDAGKGEPSTASSMVSQKLTPIFPGRFDAEQTLLFDRSVRFDSSDGPQTLSSKASLSIRPVKPNPAQLSFSSGAFVYPDAFSSTDIVFTASEGLVEEYIYARAPEAPDSFLYRIIAKNGIISVKQSGKRIDFIGTGGGVEFSIKQPYLIDAKMNSRECAVKLEGEDLICLSYDSEGLSYPVIIDPTWSTVSNLNVQRQRHNATLMQNGQILVTGGYTGATFLSSCEIYDIAKNTWTITQSMAYARAYHTATLLPNGFVLVAGGYNGTNYHFTAEVFNPLTSTWSTTGIMTYSRIGHTATLMDNLMVLVVGGYDGATYLDSTELYDFTTGLWENGPSMTTARYKHTATELDSGNVLVLCGFNGSVLASGELYSYSANSWQQLAIPIDTPRFDHTANLLPNGNVIVIGGNNNVSYLSSVRMFNSTNQNWFTTANLPSPRSGHATSVLPSGVLVLAGGFDGEEYLSDTMLYDFNSSSWTAGVDTGVTRARHTITILPTGDLLVVGGLNEVGTLNSSEVYNYFNGGQWAYAASLQEAKRSFASMLLPGANSVLVVGGLNDNGYALNWDQFDLVTQAWTNDLTSSPPPLGQLLSTGRQNFTLNLSDDPAGEDAVMIAGLNSLNYLSDIIEYVNVGANWTWFTSSALSSSRGFHRTTNLWSETGEYLVSGGGNGITNLDSADLYLPGSALTTTTMTYERSRHTATLLDDRKVLVTGGSGGSFTAELWDPATGLWTETGNMAFSRSNHTATKLFDGRVLVAGGSNGAAALSTCEIYDPVSGTWSIVGSMTAARESHTATLLYNGYVLVVGGFNSFALSSAELYNPNSGNWLPAFPLETIRTGHETVFLPDGEVLVMGGFDGTATLTTTMIFDPGMGVDPAWQPVVISSPSSVECGSLVVFTLANTRGVLEGNSGSSSPSNHPFVVLRSISNNTQRYLPVVDWTTTTVTCLMPGPAVIEPGYHIGWVVVNGIISDGFYLFREYGSDITVGLNCVNYMFGATAGESNPPSQLLTVRNFGSGTLSWTVDNLIATWLSLTPTSGASNGETDPSTVELAVDISGLVAGYYTETDGFDITDSIPPPTVATTQTVNVLLTVNPQKTPVTSLAPVISLVPASGLSFATPSDVIPSAKTFTVSNNGGGILNWYAMDDAAWLTVYPANGSITEETSVLSVFVDPSSLDQGTYTALITIYSEEVGVTPSSIPVTLNVTAPLNPALIGRSPSSMAFYSTEVGTSPDFLVLSVWNAGGATLNWVLESTEVWLDLDTPSGSSTGEIDTCVVTVDSFDMPAGVYTAQVKISDSTAANSPQYVNITFNVAYPGDKTAPTAPTLLSPVNNSLLYNQKPAFIWDDVIDDSGVTYSLQIDNNFDFSTPELSADMLTAANYTPTASLSYGLYYWRVKAVDGNNNDSSWSTSWAVNISKAPYDTGDDTGDDTPAPTPTTEAPGSASKECFLQSLFR